MRGDGRSRLPLSSDACSEELDADPPADRVENVREPLQFLGRDDCILKTDATGLALEETTS